MTEAAILKRFFNPCSILPHHSAYDPVVFAANCKHPRCQVYFDYDRAMKMTVEEIHKEFPRFCGTCPDCGWYGVLYASYEHYIAGDW